ncbi:hypothetical protein [Bacillus safensis]|uniref:hypothetical protein n=1 Tax=Bacillus safensis TaxID=561879 RepID=UPI000B4454F9|nr:hypothetical protein [Bacillus safensis]UDB49855.1 hypothetical protein BWL10_10935 [Bacillus safensis]
MKFELEASDLEKITNDVIASVSAALIPKIEEMFMVISSQDELLTKKQVYENILKCTAATADELYFNRPDFPTLDLPSLPGVPRQHKRYSRKAVEAWIAANTKGRL